MRMKVTKLVALSLLLAVASTSDADARPRPARSGGLKSFQANKTFGLGLELGEPTGLNGKVFFTDQIALDFGVGYIWHSWGYGEGFHTYADVLFHPFVFVSTDAFELPFYVGGGLRYWNFRYCDYRDPRFCADYGGSAIGIRVPGGVSLDFNDIPLDIFGQVVPTLDFIYGDYYYYRNRRVDFSFDFSVGIRYWFF